MTTQVGMIVGFRSSLGSGLATLFVEKAWGGVVAIPCEAGPASRTLRSAFGDRVLGREISFVVDDLGILASFTPVEEVVHG